MDNNAYRSGNTTSALKGTISFQGLGSRVFDFSIEKKKKRRIFLYYLPRLLIIICLWPSPVIFLNKINSLKIHSSQSFITIVTKCSDMN